MWFEWMSLENKENLNTILPSDFFIVWHTEIAFIIGMWLFLFI